MKTKLFYFLALLAVAFVSCEKEETPEDEKPAAKTVELLDSYKVVNGDLTVNESYTYNDDLQLIVIKRTMGESTSEYELEYNADGQLTKVLQNGSNYADYSYNGNQVSYTNYYMGEVSGVRICEVNSNNKIIREQLEGSDYYTTYVWDGDNMESYTIHNPDGVTKTTTTYTYNLDILAAGFNMYFGYEHPMHSCKNACTESLWSYNDEVTVYTVSAYDNGYVSKIINTNILGKQTQTFNYKTVELAE